MKTTTLAKTFAGLMVALLTLASVAQAAQTITLAWQPSPDQNVAGYRLYFGLSAGELTNSFDLGNVTSKEVSGLEDGQTYFFHVRAYNDLGVESDPSNELSYTVPASTQGESEVGGESGNNGSETGNNNTTVPAPSLSVLRGEDGLVGLTVAGAAGQYEVQATSDYQTWTALGQVAVGASGLGSFKDLDSGNHSHRFYRVALVQ